MAVFYKSKMILIIAALLISFAVFGLVGLISSIVVSNFFANSSLVNYSLYEGYADLSSLYFYILLSALLIFNRLKGNAFLIAIGALDSILLIRFLVIDVVAHYFRIYVNTQQNGNYSFEIFKDKLTSQWDSLLFELSNLGQLLSFVVWQYIALLGICYLSLWANKRIGELNFKTI